MRFTSTHQKAELPKARGSSGPEGQATGGDDFSKGGPEGSSGNGRRVATPAQRPAEAVALQDTVSIITLPSPSLQPFLGPHCTLATPASSSR